MANSFFDWTTSLARFVRLDSARAEDVNGALDLVSAGMDGVELKTNAAIKLPSGETAAPIGNVSARALKVLSFDAAGQPITDVLAGDIALAAGNAATATTKASEAAASALAAHNSEVAAAASAATLDMPPFEPDKFLKNDGSNLAWGDIGVIPQNSQSTAYTCVLSDSGKHLLHPSADTTARVFTIPANASVAYPIGTALTFVNQASAGVMTIAINSDVMRLAGAGTTGSRTLAANGVATAIKLTATEWIISGGGSLT